MIDDSYSDVSGITLDIAPFYKDASIRSLLWNNDKVSPELKKHLEKVSADAMRTAFSQGKSHFEDFDIRVEVSGYDGISDTNYDETIVIELDVLYDSSQYLAQYSYYDIVTDTVQSEKTENILIEEIQAGLSEFILRKQKKANISFTIEVDSYGE